MRVSVRVCRWGATPLQDAYLSGDQVMCALLERAGGKRADHPAIKDKLPAQLVSAYATALLAFNCHVQLVITCHGAWQPARVSSHWQNAVSQLTACRVLTEDFSQ